MGFIGKIIQHFISDSVREVVTELYSNYNKTSTLILPPGIDACPILGDQDAITGYDKLILLEVDSAGRTMAIGVIPPGLVLEGEFKIFARNIKTGAQVSYVLCKTDGNIELNGNTDFAVRYNQLEIAFNQLKADFDAHTHPYVDTPIGASTTSAILVGSTADITPAKVDTVLIQGVTP